MQTTGQLQVDQDALAGFCGKWGIGELSVFGSVLRDDFGPNSDIDVLIDLLPASACSLWDMPEMADELATLFGRKADLVFKGGLRNPFLRREILGSRQVLYAA